MPSIQDVAMNFDPLQILTKYIEELSEKTGRNVIVYYSGFLDNSSNGCEINDMDMNGFMSVIHKLDKSKGLDLVLHTPGGSVTATEALINYLHEIFGNDIRAIVPQMSMSGGTMIACSCNSILMGKHSSLGPVDPQINGAPAQGIIDSFDRAINEIDENNPSTIIAWQSLISQYSPVLIQECYQAIELSKEILEYSLSKHMFGGDENATDKTQKIMDILTSHEATKDHGRHIGLSKCLEMGLKIERLEDDDDLQDKVLSLHHAIMNILNNKQVIKLIMNQKGKMFLAGKNPN